MKVKETIAFIGKPDEFCTDLIRRLALEKHPIVLVTHKENQFLGLSQQILNLIPQADIETIDCVKEGCWEADVIVLIHAGAPNPEFMEKIRQVATQKILVYLSGDGNNSVSAETLELSQRLLPHTDVVQVAKDAGLGGWHITGADGPVAAIDHILTQAGYQTLLTTNVN